MSGTLPRRRRIYLMRHGSVDYFLADGTPVAPDTVPLNETGRQQADAAGELFKAAGVRFDRVVVSGLPRTVETASRVLAAAGQAQLPLVQEPRLQEIRGGRLSDIPKEQLRGAFLGAFQGTVDESSRFLGGESIGEMQDRALPAFQELLRDEGWQQLLLVLHGGVNRALLSYALAGQRCFLGRMEQAPACINVMDISSEDMVVRGINLAPTQWLHERERYTTMEKLLAQYLRMEGSTPRS
ncbi:histidine phosphatase family protein [Aquabacterium sp. A7-Y]|uniref:histidine phosphatase family protein n=1 Tax=Aquabacterium sp. A7-Y TaxID=1349605 RepID=UPI00223E254F|nr:histidine phosphatase family protein [Aquabacterium sp. A7-Y]MCW7537857.1 histidine phosphatase family protein [Aquabacterium sp. A7-Y]